MPSLSVTLHGGAGGGAQTAVGGDGAEVTTTLAVTPAETLNVGGGTTSGPSMNVEIMVIPIVEGVCPVLRAACGAGHYGWRHGVPGSRSRAIVSVMTEGVLSRAGGVAAGEAGTP